MSTGTAATVITLDLRTATTRLADPDELHRAVRESLAAAPRREQVAPAERFLLLDTAEGLAPNQRVYEQVLSYGSGRALCVAVGAPPAEPGDGVHLPAAPTPWALERPATLRPPAVGVLWVLDPYCGTGTLPMAEGAADGQDSALRPLLDLLSTPAVFDAVLRAVGEIPDGVAVPELRVLEQDLSPGARERAWRQALSDLVGEDDPGGRVALADPEAGGVPAVLAPLVGAVVPKSAQAAEWRRPGGEVEERFRACVSAFDAAEQAYEHRRLAGGLLGGAGQGADPAECLEDAATALGAYRHTVAEAFRDGDGVGLPPEQRRRLHEHGIDLPRVPEASRERIGPGLRGFTQDLLARRLPLCSTAARLAALADLATPAGSAARLGQLDEICPPALPDRLAARRPFTVGGQGYGELAAAAVVAAGAGLWPGPGWATGTLVALAASGLTALALARRPGRGQEGRLDGGGTSGALPQLGAGLLGALAGAAVGTVLGVPAWLGLSTLLLALLALPLLAVRRWTTALDDWWTHSGAAQARDALLAVDDLLADTVVHDWLLGDARLYCADGARAVAGLIRRAATAAEGRDSPVAVDTTAPFTPPPTPPSSDGWDDWDDWDDWDGAADSATEPFPDGWDAPTSGVTSASASGGWPEPTPQEDDSVSVPWLEREAGDGGPELVATLVGDFVDGITGLLAPYWGSIERDPGAAAALPLEQKVRELLAEESNRLGRDGAAAPPSFARRPDDRPDPFVLLGVAPERVVTTLGTQGEGASAVALCAAVHQRVLSRDQHARRQVRFAPESVRQGAGMAQDGDGRGSGGSTDDVVWTPAGRYAGVFRLVPLRTGSVRTVRPQLGADSRADPPTEPFAGPDRQESGQE